MPAKGQDVWFRPLTPIPITEPRWVRAVEMRPATPEGRRITHHALAYLQQEEPGSNTGIATQGLLMEWAINKNYDVSGQTQASCLFQARASGGRRIIMRPGRRSATTSSWRSTFIPKDRSRSTAHFSRRFQLRPAAPDSATWIFRRIPSLRPKAMRHCARRRGWRTSNRICTCAVNRC